MNNLNNKRLFAALIFSLLCWREGISQARIELSLDSCFNKAERNYPQIIQYDLIAKSTAYSIENAQKRKLPQVTIVGQASYQSEVTSLPGGTEMGVAELSKDQYQLYGEIVQPLTGIIITNQEQKLLKIDGEISAADLATKMYTIKQRVSDLFFGILLIHEQLKQSELTKDDLEAGLSVMNASVQYGTALTSSLDILRAQLINLEQRMIEQEAARDGYLKMLGLFIDEELNETTQFTSPLGPPTLSTRISRPELQLFDAKIRSVVLQDQLLKKSNLPQLSLFLQSGFGRPALNFLSNDFEPYYIGGLKLSWNLSNFYANKGKKEIFNINKSIWESEKETFLFNTQMTLSSQDVQIRKAEKLIEKDREIISLRDRIVTTSKASWHTG